MWNTIGLFMNMAGVFIIITSMGAVNELIQRNKRAAANDKNEETLVVKHAIRNMWMKIGMLLILGGFFMQLLGSW